MPLTRKPIGIAVKIGDGTKRTIGHVTTASYNCADLRNALTSVKSRRLGAMAARGYRQEGGQPDPPTWSVCAKPTLGAPGPSLRSSVPSVKESSYGQSDASEHKWPSQSNLGYA